MSMTHEEKIEWMKGWAERNGCTLQLEGECGFGRECVGILAQDLYPDYTWRDDKTYERIDNNGEVWTPESAYHKHDCVAVLGRGEYAEAQLFEWLQWFEANKFRVEQGQRKPGPDEDEFVVALLGLGWSRMVREGCLSGMETAA
jgi:hypothetical protein